MLIVFVVEVIKYVTMAVKLMEILVSVVAVLVWATHIVMMPMVVLSELCVVAGVPLHHVRVVVVVDHV